MSDSKVFEEASGLNHINVEILSLDSKFKCLNPDNPRYFTKVTRTL